MARLRKDANKEAKRADITRTGEKRRKKVNLYFINQIGFPRVNRLTTSLSYSLSRDTISIEFLGVSATGGHKYNTVFNVASTSSTRNLRPCSLSQ